MRLFKLLLISTNLLKLSLILTGLGALEGCGIQIKEEDFYTDRGNDGAVETHFFATDVVDIGKPAWDSLREGMTCMSGQAISDIKTEIEELCTKTSCTAEVLTARQQALAALNRLQ
jgi:hypothetical protein